jgi:hypothetical protein
MTKDSIVLHHSGSSGSAPQYASVSAYHDSGAGGKWPKGHGIQYPHFVEKNGNRVSTGDDSRLTWHAGNREMNERGIGVCLAGDFTVEQPTEEQLDTLATLTTDIQTRYGIPDSRIFLHREVRDSPTACPGTDLRALLFARRAELLRGRLPALERALRYARGLRKSVLTRLIERVRRAVR